MTLSAAATSSGANSALILLDGRRGDALALPPEVDLTGAWFERIGPDLLVHLADGGHVLIGGYFANPDQPDLVPAGAPAVLGALLAMIPAEGDAQVVAQAGPGAAGAQAIGRVTTVNGTVTATRLDGSVERLQVGSEIFQGDVLQTGPKAAVAIIFADNATFALDQNARMVVDTYLFAPATGKGTLAVSVLNGVFGFASGDIVANTPGAMTIKTPRAIAGVRGSEGGGQAGDETDTFFLNSGEIVVTAFGGSVVLSSANPVLATLMVVVGGGVPEVTTRTVIEDHSFTRVIELLPEQPGGHKGIVPTGDQDHSGDAAALGLIAPAAGPLDFGQADGPIQVTLGFVPSSPPARGGGLIELLGAASGELILPVLAPLAPAELPDTLIPPPATPPPPGLTVVGSDAGDLIVGSAFPDILFGGGGNDILDGGGGDDLLDGGEGDDVLDGGTGNDDLRGGTGDDTIIGGHGEGDDAIDGGADTDTVTFTSTDEGVIVDLAAGFATGDPDIGVDSIANVENVVGGSGDDFLLGDDGANRLEGGDGDDVLAGRGGDDELIGGNGDDVLFGGGGNNLLVDGAGRDTALFEGFADTFDISLAAGTVTNRATGETDTLDGVESAAFIVDGNVVREVFFDGTNNAPIGGPDAFLLPTGETLVVDGEHTLLANDVDLEGEPLHVVGSVFHTLAGGVVQMTPAGSFSYRAPEGFTGVDGFEYLVADSDPGRVDRVPVVIVVGEAAGEGFTTVDAAAATLPPGEAIAGTT